MAEGRAARALGELPMTGGYPRSSVEQRPDRTTRCTVDPLCERCGSIELPQGSTTDGRWRCQSCGAERARRVREAYVTTLAQLARSVAVVGDGQDRGLPTTDARCEACGHERAYWDIQQLRAGDESPTLLYICTACEHTWREDD